jgi:hypothetical protein
MITGLGLGVAGLARHMGPVEAATQPVVFADSAMQVQPVDYAYPAPGYGTQQNYTARRAYAPADRVVTPRRYSATSPYRVQRGRSTGKSAAIVAGSAGAGALIGGLTHGKKGAALGAIAGGAGGFVVDRLTDGRPVNKNRSKTTSAAIIGGSAGTGAAIGALTAGGKGAAIGAGAGAAAGLLYDQITRHQ